MRRFRIYSRNLLAIWGVHGANLLVAFFLSPFVVHTLGDVRYGIWSLVLSVVGYMGLADVGLRRSISKHLNQYLAQKNNRKALEVVSTSLALLLVVGILITVCAYLLSRWFHLFFDGVSDVYADEVKVVLLVAALQLWVGLLGSTFRRAVEAFDRFDMVSVVEVVVLLLRAGGFVVVLSASPSLVGLAIVGLAAGLARLAGFVALAYRVWPGLRVSPSYCSSNAARVLGSFGVPAFLDSICWRVIRFTDLIVVGVLLGVQSVTTYAIGLMIAAYARNFLVKIVTVLTPEIFKKTGMGDHAASRHLFLRAANATAFVSIPVLIGCLFFAEEFIRLWMGPEYHLSARVMQVLAVSTLVMVCTRPSRVIILGYGRAWLAASLSVVQAALNLGLSILFVKLFDLGVVGVALGTLIPAVIIEGLCRPLIATRLMRMRIGLFGKAVFRWVFVASLFAGACLAARLIPTATWFVFFVTTSMLGLMYVPIGWYSLLDKETRAAVRLG